MFYYAQIDENEVCTGLSCLSGEVSDNKLIRIGSFEESYLWKKYNRDTQTWSTETYEPQSAVPLSRLEEAEQQIEALTLAILQQGV